MPAVTENYWVTFTFMATLTILFLVEEINLLFG